MEKKLLSYLRKQSNSTILAEEGSNFLAKMDNVCIVFKDSKVEIFKVEGICTITSGFKSLNSLEEFDNLFNTIKNR